MIHATTILAVRHQDHTVLAGDGQVTLGNTVIKQGARKIRRLYNESILAGFAGSAADSFALFSRFESKLEQYRGNLERSAVELARDWRTDRLLRRLDHFRRNEGFSLIGFSDFGFHIGFDASHLKLKSPPVRGRFRLTPEFERPHLGKRHGQLNGEFRQSCFLSVSQNRDKRRMAMYFVV